MQCARRRAGWGSEIWRVERKSGIFEQESIPRDAAGHDSGWGLGRHQLRNSQPQLLMAES